MTRSHAIDLCGERFALLALFNKKGNETTLETIYHILKFWLLFHNNNIVLRFMFLVSVMIKMRLPLEQSSRLASRERHAEQVNDLAKR